jgi:hypothetical protein
MLELMEEIHRNAVETPLYLDLKTKLALKEVRGETIALHLDPSDGAFSCL